MVIIVFIAIGLVVSLGYYVFQSLSSQQAMVSFIALFDPVSQQNTVLLR
jgi:hypothetical protein